MKAAFFTKKEEKRRCGGGTFGYDFGTKQLQEHELGRRLIKHAEQIGKEPDGVGKRLGEKRRRGDLVNLPGDLPICPHHR